jgi:hypothetical protein
MSKRIETGLITAFLASVLLLAGCGGPRGGIYVGTPPPPPIVERAPIAPGPGYVWVPGYHVWNGNAYVWTPGRWNRPPDGRRRWVPGHWVHTRRGWRWIEGHWR